MSLKRDYKKLADEYFEAKQKLALKYAKYSIGQKLSYNNFPDSKSASGIVEHICLNLLGNEIFIVYWCKTKKDRYREVYESEVLRVLK